LRFAKTQFGKKIKVLANVTDLESAKRAKDFGADGIGLLRTEFMFKEKRPTLDEQTNMVEIYLSYLMMLQLEHWILVEISLFHTLFVI